MASDAVLYQYSGNTGTTTHLSSAGAISSNAIGYLVYNAKNKEVQVDPFPTAADADSYITSVRQNRAGNSSDGLCVLTVPTA